MARKMNLSTLEQKIEKAQQDVVKTKNAYNAATARLKELLDKRDALKKEEIYAAIEKSNKSMDEILRLILEE
ncbi:MAG TPA: hypothetical protein PKK94_28750 [Leptospiraceae bacterium]|nr:hypothetical protein [Leptospiraceae bacterium]